METKDVAKFIAGNFDARSYSGRGMYAESCIGVECSKPFKLAIDIIAAAHSTFGMDDFEDFIDIFDSLDVRTDSMGRDEIVYFPDLEWTSDYEHDKV